MKRFRISLVILFLCVTSFAQDFVLKTSPLISSPLYSEERVINEIIDRIRSGVYNGYTVDLCVDDPKRCEVDVFEPYKKEREGKIVYELRLDKGMWPCLHAEVQQAVLREIIYYTWGHPTKAHPPLDVSISETDKSSPLDLLSPHSKKMYLQFGQPEYLVGGKGKNAYGPNCWYNSIAAIADKDSHYAHKKNLAKASWEKHRFMGPTEFRFHMNSFEEVSTPQFGDIIRYYTDEEIYSGIVFGGEIHAAVYVGRADIDADGKGTLREIALTKNGRNDLNFLMFQDVEAMDEIYLAKLPEDSPLLKKSGGKDPRKKGYFRVKSGSKLLDPAEVGKISDCYAAYLIDQLNYRDRWDCLSGETDPPPGDNDTCYDYPCKWLILKSVR